MNERTSERNYRQAIIDIATRTDTSANDDWERALLDGAPDHITATDALGIADWLEDEAPSAWDCVHPAGQIARQIRLLIAGDLED